MSLKEALSWTTEQGFKVCVFETDSKFLADACNGGTGKFYFHTIVRNCVALFKQFEIVRVQFVHRYANEVVRTSHSMSGLRKWRDNAPNFHSNIIISEMS